MIPTGFSKVNASIVGGTAVFLLAGLLTAAGLIWEARAGALDESSMQSVRFADSAVAALNRTVLGIDVMLANLDDLLGLAALQPEQIEPRAANRLMRGAVQQNLIVRYVALIDQKAKVLASSNDDAQATLTLPSGFVDSVLAEPSPALIISAPTINTTSSERVLYLARYVRLADDSKVLAVAELQLPMLTALLLQGVNIAGLEVSLERINGQLLASAPPIAERNDLGATPLAELQAAPTALLRPARLSGVPALVTARPMLYGNIYLAAGIPVDAALAGWRSLRNLILGASLVFGLMTLAACGTALWYVRRMAQARKTIAEAKGSLDQALESMVTGFLLLNADDKVVSWNRRFIELFPWVQKQVAPGVQFQVILQQLAQHVLEHATTGERKAWVEQHHALQGKPEPHEKQLPSGAIIQVTERRTPEGGVVIVYEDVTKIRAAAAAIQQLAFYDSLTQLPNRRLLNDRLQVALAATPRSGQHGALLFLDLDHFKQLNDTLGHDMGDILLQQVATRLLTCVRNVDTVARLGGDEFVVMLENLGQSATEAEVHARRVGEKIVVTLNQPYQLGEHVHLSTTSVGATLFSASNQNSVELLKQADIAMYQVKAAGRNAFNLFGSASLLQ